MLKERCAHLVVVTNDVFRESVPDSEEMTAYKDNLGTISRALAKMADRVTEVVFGVPVCIKEVSDTASGTWDWIKGIDAQKDGSGRERTAQYEIHNRRRISGENLNTRKKCIRMRIGRTARDAPFRNFSPAGLWITFTSL